MRYFAADMMKTEKVFTLFGSSCYFNSFTLSLSPKHLLFESVSGPLRRLRGVRCLTCSGSALKILEVFLGVPRVLQVELKPPSRTVPSYLFLLKQGDLHYLLLVKNQETWQARPLENAAVWVCKREV